MMAHEPSGLQTLVLTLQGEDGEKIEESLWVQPREGGFEVRNSPFVLTQIALGDVLFAKSEGWRIKHGGNATLLVLFHEEASGVKRRVMRALRDLECLFEVGGNALSICVPPAAKSRVMDLIDDDAAPWDWTFLKE